MIGFLAVVAGMIGRMTFSVPHSGRSLLTVAFVGGLFVALMGLSLYSLKNDRMGERMRTLPQDFSAPADNVRIQVAEATWQMAEDALALGWGAGSYRYIFPGYQAGFPAIMYARDSHKRLLFEHAHNDYLELLAELGIVGGIILAAGLVWHLIALGRLRVWRNQAVSILFLGCIVTSAHAAFDFPFANPAVLTTWCCLWPAMLRWLELESEKPQL
jgi:O-antigen ligase